MCLWLEEVLIEPLDIVYLNKSEGLRRLGWTKEYFGESLRIDYNKIDKVYEENQFISNSLLVDINFNNIEEHCGIVLFSYLGDYYFLVCVHNGASLGKGIISLFRLSDSVGFREILSANLFCFIKEDMERFCHNLVLLYVSHKESSCLDAVVKSGKVGLIGNTLKI